MINQSATDRPLLLDMLKAADYARYLSVLFAPEEKREALSALYLYSIELARVPQLVREPVAGEIRLQWWQEVLDGQRDDEAMANPISKALLGAIAAHNLPRTSLATMAEARIFDLYNDPMPDLKSFEGYCGELYSVAYQMAVMILSGDASEHTAELSGHAGMVSGISAVLRRLPQDLAAQKCPVPREIIAANGLSADDLADGIEAEKFYPVVEALQALGRDHQKQFQSARKALKRRDKSQILNAYLPVVIDEYLLAQIKSDDLFKQPYSLSNFTITRKILGRALLG